MKFFEDDMDELFNKAGRHYPLKTEPKNWEAVSSALHGDEASAPAKAKQNRYRRWLPLLLLLLIPAVYVYLDKENVKQNDLAEETKNLTAVDVTNNQAEETDKRSNTSAKVKSQRLPIMKQEKATKSAITETIQAGRQSIQAFSRNVETTIRHYPSQQKINLSENTQETNNIYASTNLPRPLYLNNLPAPPATIAVTDVSKKLVQPNGSASVPKLDKKASKHKAGLYYGAIAAPDVSTIKSQRVEGLGYSAGLIAGYNFNARWALEGGVLWSRKKYYTDGKYFSKTGAQIPDYVAIHWLDGGCEMFEFPVSVRYHFSDKKNTWFASAGVTSYMMKKEDYTYGASAGVAGNYYEGYKAYNRSGDHLFANLQLSAGYKWAISSKTNIRIEPYLKAPLKKIGIGKMPVTSTGLYFSLTRDFR